MYQFRLIEQDPGLESFHLPNPDLGRCNLYSRLSNASKERLEIGTGTLEMGLDQELESRIEFWSKIW